MTRFLRPLPAVVLLAFGCAQLQLPPETHPPTSGSDWVPLFDDDLSNAINSGGVWRFEEGLLTASEDRELWTDRSFDDYILDLEFRNAEGTNSGVIVHASDLADWVPNSVEIQIADDHAPEWANSPASWRAGAFFGRKPASAQTVKQPGEWNHMTITTRGDMIWVMLNGEHANEMDMRAFTSATTNPDGSEAPEWLSKPPADLPRHGHIGLQGKHGDAPIWFRNVRIRELD